MGRGFTILEITITIGIISLLGTFATVSFMNSRAVRELTTEGQNVISTLRLAQARTLAGEGNAPWGLRFTPNSYTLFRGSSFLDADFTQTHTLPSGLELVDILLAGAGQDVIFKRVSGETGQYGTAVLRHRSDQSRVFSITIDASGKVFQTSPAPAAAGTRLTDTRHREFALGWTIKNSSTLTLTFSDPPDPDTIRAITMAPPSPRIAFDWSDIISVGDQKQALRIHAVAITDTNTTLHIDRDCRKNTKKVNIAIDAKEIAAFDADCKTITAGPFGGTMREP